MMSIIQVGNVLLSSDIITECFCCDLDACKGICCIEGDAGAPVLFEEIAPLEEATEIARRCLYRQRWRPRDLYCEQQRLRVYLL